MSTIASLLSKIRGGMGLVRLWMMSFMSCYANEVEALSSRASLRVYWLDPCHTGIA
jgi:hypothetical protein